MKRLLILVAAGACLIPQMSFAAERNAEISLLGGFSQEKDKSKQGDADEVEVTSNTFSVSGSHLWILAPFAVGPYVGYSSTREKNDDKSTNSWSANLGVEAKYYLTDIKSEKLVPYAAARVGYLQGKFGDAKTTGQEYGLGVGAHYFLNDTVALTPELQYKITNTTLKVEDVDDKTKSKNDDLSLSFGISAFI